ncbi:hypothetical protein J6590_057797 [Homalodisca vitripennis]|nr:hypothetical protein J6590_057797 [Homalodisca vitripennis]
MRHVVGRRPSSLVCRVPGRVQVSAGEGWPLRTHRLVTLSCQSVLVSTIVRFSSVTMVLVRMNVGLWVKYPRQKISSN